VYKSFYKNARRNITAEVKRNPQKLLEKWVQFRTTDWTAELDHLENAAKEAGIFLSNFRLSKMSV
jgi:hypothetical protein